MKSWLPLIAIPLFFLSLVELSCFAFFSLFEERFTFFDPSQFLLKEELIPKAASVYDKDLGWKHQYKTEFGERPRPREFGRARISMFGDSYTHCDQVKHHETFQTYLSKKLKADVYNFGVGGFGTDQAYLRFLKDYPKVKTPVVVLGLITENINRVHNVYRPFYYEKTRGMLPKPRFRLVNGELELLENPLPSKAEISNLTKLSFIQSLGEHDVWYNRDSYPTLSFPFTRILFSKRMWLELSYGKGDAHVDDMDPRPWENLWEIEDSRTLMFRIFDSFVQKSRAQGAEPVIMLFPRKRETWTQYRGEEPENVARIMSYCRQHGYRCFDSVSALVKHAKTEEHLRSFYNGHLSAKGNRVLAKEFYIFLKDHNLHED